MPTAQPVIAVDAKTHYCEIDMGALAAGIHKIHLDRTSDWALSIGEYGDRILTRAEPMVAGGELPSTTTGGCTASIAKK